MEARGLFSEVNMPFEESQDKQKPKALFIVDSTAQAEMFKPIAEELSDWDTVAINTDRWNKREEMEKVLQELNFPHKTIAGLKLGNVREIFRKERPDIIVVGHDRNLMDRLFVRYANKMGIPTLLVQDGILAASRDKTRETGSFSSSLGYAICLPVKAFRFIMNRDYSWRRKIETALFELRYGTRGKSGIYGHGECVKMALFGDTVKKMFISERIDPERIVVTGNPKFDKVYYSRDSNCKQKVCERWGIPPDKEIILLLTQYFVEAGHWDRKQRRQFTLAVIKAVSTLPDTQLIIKLHPPSENEEDYNEIVKGLIPPPIICKYASLPELLNACSLAITVSSTAALEAMAIGKPVVIVELFNDSGDSFYKESGALFAEREEDISSAMQKALYDPQTREEMAKSMEKFVYQQAYLQDGQASKRIADLIVSMVTGNKPPQQI